MSETQPYWPNGFFEELAQLDAASDLGGMHSERLRDMSQRAAEEVVETALADPGRALMQERGEQAGFEARLQARWGPALERFAVTLNQALQTGQWINSDYRPRAADRRGDKFEALIRLHGRAVMIAQEVLLLLRGGYSTGALTRWRTIHEVWVVFAILTDADQQLSRRYLAHDVVESMRAQGDYEETWQALGFEPPDWGPSEREETRASLREQFGAAFLQNYGWAAPVFDGRPPTFKDLQRFAELDHWRGYYRMASHGTHANPKGITWNIQDVGTSNVVWAGPSNAGLVDPAQCTLIALSNVTVGLLEYCMRELLEEGETLVALVRQHTILLATERSIELLVATQEQLEGEEQELDSLLDRARSVLCQTPELTVTELADELEVEPDQLQEALTTAISRGRLDAQTRYFVNGMGPQNT